MSEKFNSNRSNDLFIFNSKKDYLPWILILAAIALAVLQLWRQGRVWWCQVGDYAPWSWTVLSAHNSQHLIDPYTFTHILHGILFFWITSLIFGKLPLAWRLLIAISVECAWEIVENTNTVIQRYREATISLDYFGDSIINSLGDILSFSFGFWLAGKLRFWLSLGFFVVVEIILIFCIRDSLVLNIIMLIYPIEAIKRWQAGS
ncbi:MAG TPA: DUF2585 family protein [Pyrinomonadaceae bacterium]|jgi:hypothetical protein